MTEESLALRAVHLVRTTGLPCFPCLENKAPATPHGFKDAARTPGEVYRLFSRYPQARLIGVPTGTISDLAVIDIDPGGHRWQQTISSLRLPETRVHRTRRGGWHILYRCPVPNGPPAFKNSASKLARYVDTRGDGGFIVWWPASGGEVSHDAEMVPCPQWILRALYREPKQRFSHRGRGDEAGSKVGGLEALSSFVARSNEGERHNRLFWAACRCGEAINRGQLHFSDAVGSLLSAVRSCSVLSTPIDILAAERTVREGIRRGRQEMRK